MKTFIGPNKDLLILFTVVLHAYVDGKIKMRRYNISQLLNLCKSKQLRNVKTIHKFKIYPKSLSAKATAQKFGTPLLIT